MWELTTLVGSVVTFGWLIKRKGEIFVLIAVAMMFFVVFGVLYTSDICQGKQPSENSFVTCKVNRSQSNKILSPTGDRLSRKGDRLTSTTGK